jgi:hypothetical protein
MRAAISRARVSRAATADTCSQATRKQAATPRSATLACATSRTHSPRMPPDPMTALDDPRERPDRWRLRVSLRQSLIVSLGIKAGSVAPLSARPQPVRDLGTGIRGGALAEQSATERLGGPLGRRRRWRSRVSRGNARRTPRVITCSFLRSSTIQLR